MFTSPSAPRTKTSAPPSPNISHLPGAAGSIHAGHRMGRWKRTGRWKQPQGVRMGGPGLSECGVSHLRCSSAGSAVWSQRPPWGPRTCLLTQVLPHTQRAGLTFGGHTCSLGTAGSSRSLTIRPHSAITLHRTGKPFTGTRGCEMQHKLETLPLRECPVTTSAACVHTVYFPQRGAGWGAAKSIRQEAGAWACKAASTRHRTHWRTPSVTPQPPTTFTTPHDPCDLHKLHNPNDPLQHPMTPHNDLYPTLRPPPPPPHPCCPHARKQRSSTERSPLTAILGQPPETIKPHMPLTPETPGTQSSHFYNSEA